MGGINVRKHALGKDLAHLRYPIRRGAEYGAQALSFVISFGNVELVGVILAEVVYLCYLVLP